MRDDMAKVIVERPRWGGGGVKYPRGSVRETDRVAIEDWRKRQGIQQPWQGTHCEKGLNENLAPLRRFLGSRVGRPWDKVYSEICERINRNSAVQLHIWQHLVDYVCTNPYEIDGDVGRHWFGRLLYEYFVEPRTGILRRNEEYGRSWNKKRRRAVREMPTIVPIDVNRCYEQIDGIWYELDLRPRPDGGMIFEPATHQWIPFNPRGGYRDYQGWNVYVARKRQLNTKEIRQVARRLERSAKEKGARR